MSQQPLPQQPLRRDFEKYNAHGPSRNKGPKLFFMPQGARTSVVLLDDVPVRLCRHKLFIKGDKQAAQMRQTCAGMDPAQFPDPVPRSCLVCETSIRDRRIGRDDFANLSLIDERQFEYNGRQFQDMKNIVELDDRLRDIINENRKQWGTLVGMRFNVYRSDVNNSSRIGDSWTPVGRVDLVRHFWKSPAVAALLEAEQRRGAKDITYQKAVAMLIAPVDYATVMGTYVPTEAEQFCAYVTGSTSGDGGGGGRGGSFRPEVPPVPGGDPMSQAMPSHSVPQTPQAPPYAPPPQHPQMPPGQPGYPPQGMPMGMAQGMPPQGYGQPPQGYAQPPAPQGYAPPPPPAMPDPMGATPPSMQPQAPPPMQQGYPGGGFAPPPPPPMPGYQQQHPQQGFAPPPPPPPGATFPSYPPQGYAPPAQPPQWSPQPPGFAPQPPPPPAQPPQHGQVPPQGAHGGYNDPPF